MNYYETLTQLATEHQQRQPGSPGAAAVITQIKDLITTWNVTAQTSKVVNYQFQKSLWVMTGIGLLTFSLGFVSPFSSLIGAILLGGLLLRELSQPLLGKDKSVTAENLLVDLPAKNKEAQKVFLVASFDTEEFIKTPFSLKPETYLPIIFGIISAMSISSLLYILNFGIVFNCLNLLFLIGLIILNLSVKSPAHRDNSLKNCAVLLETAAILNKVKPDITSVALCFCASRSLNSGIVAFNPEFSRGPEDLTYVVNLVESASNNVTSLQCLTSEGVLPSKPTSAILLGVMQEVARDKALTLTTAKTSEYTETYPLNRSKIQPITIVIPKSESVSLREVRELLCGLIRKLDH